MNGGITVARGIALWGLIALAAGIVLAIWGGAWPGAVLLCCAGGAALTLAVVAARRQGDHLVDANVVVEPEAPTPLARAALAEPRRSGGALMAAAAIALILTGAFRAPAVAAVGGLLLALAVLLLVRERRAQARRP